MVDQFYVKFGDPGCSVLEISCGKKETDRQTPLKTLHLRLPLA